MSEWTKDQRYCTVCAAAVLLGFLALALYLSPESPSPIRDTTEQTGGESPNQKQPEGFWGKVLADPLIAFTGILAAATAILAFATFRGVVLARDEFNASHRPRIRIRRIRTLQPQVGKNHRATIEAANIGDTVAQIAAIGVDIFPRIPGHPEPEPFDARPMVQVNPVTVGVGQQADLNVMGGRPLTNAQVLRIQEGAAESCLLGIIQYRDARGALRLTSFFRIYERHRARFRRAPQDDEYTEWEYED